MINVENEKQVSFRTRLYKMIPGNSKRYTISNDFTAKEFGTKSDLIKDLDRYNIIKAKDYSFEGDSITVRCKDMYGHGFDTIIKWDIKRR